MHFQWLVLKKCSSSSSIFKILMFLASASSFNVKNDNFHTFFFVVLVANFEFGGFAPKQKFTDLTVSTETVRTANS